MEKYDFRKFKQKASFIQKGTQSGSREIFTMIMPVGLLNLLQQMYNCVYYIISFQLSIIKTVYG